MSNIDKVIQDFEELFQLPREEIIRSILIVMEDIVGSKIAIKYKPESKADIVFLSNDWYLLDAIRIENNNTILQEIENPLTDEEKAKEVARLSQEGTIEQKMAKILQAMMNILGTPMVLEYAPNFYYKCGFLFKDKNIVKILTTGPVNKTYEA